MTTDLLREVIPFIISQNQHGAPLVTGCSFGAYHAVNFALRHPDLVEWMREHGWSIRHSPVSERIL